MSISRIPSSCGLGLGVARGILLPSWMEGGCGLQHWGRGETELGVGFGLHVTPISDPGVSAV